MGKPDGGGVDGLVVVDKPPGCTSHDVVSRLRKAYGTRKVGHAGTLDPDATGVLLVGVGRVTRLLRFLTEAGKTYRGEIAFGAATDTLDAGGAVVARRSMPDLTESALRGVLGRFVGEVSQTPPMVSALKVGGKRLHELARQGEAVERAPRLVRIDEITLEAFSGGDEPRATVVVACGSGVYIRSLAADIGSALGGLAHLGWLRRLAVGPFSLADAHPLADIEADPSSALLPPAGALPHLPRTQVDTRTAEGVSHGVVFPATLLGAAADHGVIAVVGPDERLLAVYDRGRTAARPLVVLGPGPS
ncbi:MAG: tRNA pseudouridine(55) synthase TruB [Acidimicrobiia bacterium]